MSGTSAFTCRNSPNHADGRKPISSVPREADSAEWCAPTTRPWMCECHGCQGRDVYFTPHRTVRPSADQVVAATAKCGDNGLLARSRQRPARGAPDPLDPDDSTAILFSQGRKASVAETLAAAWPISALARYRHRTSRPDEDHNVSTDFWQPLSGWSSRRLGGSTREWPERAITALDAADRRQFIEALSKLSSKTASELRIAAHTAEPENTEGQLRVRALDPELVWLTHEHEPWRPRTD